MVAVEFLSGSRCSHQLFLRTVVCPGREEEKFLLMIVSVITSCWIGVGGKADSLCQGKVICLSWKKKLFSHESWVENQGLYQSSGHPLHVPVHLC